MTPSTDTHPSMEACPPLEDIAAFLDDMLSPEERERMTAHLARCESCYEVFIGAAEFQEEESSAGDTGEVVLPFPLTPRQDRDPRRTSRWFPLAASIALAAGAGYFAWQFLAPPNVVATDLIEPLQEAKAVESLYERTLRGPEDVPTVSWQEGYAFLAGVYFADFHLSVDAKDAKRASEALDRLGSEIGQISLMETSGEEYRKEAEKLKVSSDHLRELAQRLPSEEQKIRTELTEAYDLPFSFGLWAEAGRLSALTESAEFFKRRNNRRFLSRLLKEEELPVPPELQEQVRSDLQAIDGAWGKDFSSLKDRFESIIIAIQDYEEEIPETESEF